MTVEWVVHVISFLLSDELLLFKYKVSQMFQLHTFPVFLLFSGQSSDFEQAILMTLASAQEKFSTAQEKQDRGIGFLLQNCQAFHKLKDHFP